MAYIKVPKVHEKLKKAEVLFSPVIMTAANGWGKTAAAEYYYRRKRPLILHCRDENIPRGTVPRYLAEEDMDLGCRYTANAQMWRQAILTICGLFPERRYRSQTERRRCCPCFAPDCRWMKRANPWQSAASGWRSLSWITGIISKKEPGQRYLTYKAATAFAGLRG